MLENLKFNLYSAAISASADVANASGYAAVAAIAISLLCAAAGAVWPSSRHNKTGLRWTARVLATSAAAVAHLARAANIQEERHA
jgi:hypothetical protein